MTNEGPYESNCLGEIRHDLNLWHSITTVEYESVCSSPSLKLKTLKIFYLKYKLQEKLHQMYNITLPEFQTKLWVFNYLSETNQKFLEIYQLPEVVLSKRNILKKIEMSSSIP